MKFLAIIPARYASTRFPGKPLADIGGQPMIRRVYERTAAVFGDCCVATDDARIEEAVKAFGGNVVMTSKNHRSGTDRCAEALKAYEAVTDQRFDVVVNVQGDEPFIAREQLELIKGCFTDNATKIATLVKPFTPQENIFDPNTPKAVISSDGHALYFSRSVVPHLRGVEQTEWQNAHRYYKHIGLYAYRSDTLREITGLPQGDLEKAESLEQLRWLENGYRIKTAITETETIAVDTPEDLARVLVRIGT